MMAMRRTYLAAFLSLAVWGLEDGADDVVTFVQMNASKASKPVRSGAEDADARLHQDLRLEDADSLVEAAYRAAHDERLGSVEEKAIALLQNLAQHRSVAGTGAEAALLRAAAEAEAQLGAGADEEAEEARAGASHGGAAAAAAGRIFDFDWEPITFPQGTADDRGYAWHALGGKPLQCQVKSETLNGKWLKDVYQLGDFQAEGYVNSCEALCAKRTWCSGYGYSQTVNYQRKAHQVCILFNNGRGRCGENDGMMQNGILPVRSARDLILKPGPKAFLTEEDVDGTPFTMDLVEYGEAPYQLKAKYLERPSHWYYNKDVSFETVSADHKCKHSLSKPMAAVYARENEIYEDVFAFIDTRTFKNDAGATHPWSNKCEKLCAILPWCTGYAWKDRRKDKSSGAIHSLRCGLYRGVEDLPNSEDSWRGDTKQSSKIQQAAGDRNRSPAYPAKIASHLVEDEEEPGWVCKAKIFETRWKTKAGASFNCKTGFVGSIMTFAMSIVSFAGAARCDVLVDSMSSTRRAAKNVSLLSASTSVEMEADAHALMASKSFAEVFASDGSSSGGRAAGNFTRGHAKAALDHLMQDKEADSQAIRALKSARSETTRCQLQYSGQGLRFLSYALATSLHTAYMCSVLHKDKYYCRANMLRTTGGLFGSIMYGYPRIQQECGSNPWPVNTLICSGDFTKSIFYLGRAIWKFIQTVYIYKDDQQTEQVAGGIDILASLAFIGEGIVRAMGPCLGHFKNDTSAIVIGEGGCIATITEVAALGVQTLAYGTYTAKNCKTFHNIPSWM